MKRLTLFIIFLLSSLCSFSQVYTAMPADSPAAWRYRLFDVDDVTTVYDISIFLNGRDTVSGSNTYHQLSIRSHIQTVPFGTAPPIVSCVASAGDFYYGAIRESGKKIYMLSGSTELLIYDFNASVGDSIPSYAGKVKVTAIDSISISGAYHKQYHTTDAGFTAIEGIGSTRGLNPYYNDGSGVVVFHCFSNGPVTYTPDPSTPCTSVYPVWYSLNAQSPNAFPKPINIYPVPASGILHISIAPGHTFSFHAYDAVGRQVWHGDLTGNTDIPIANWPKGIYMLSFTSDYTTEVKKIVVE